MNAFGPTSARAPKTAKILHFPQPQTRKLLVPREHGSWGLWLLPLITGAVVAIAKHPGLSDTAIFWFCAASASAFLAYQPLEALLGVAPLKARSPEEKQLAATWIIFTGFIAVTCAMQLLIAGRGKVLFFALLAGACFVARMLFSRLRALRVIRQIIGALALSSTAAAAYYVISGEVDLTALVLWGANWMFAAGQIEYVQLRVRTANAHSRAEKARSGWKVYLLHLAMILVTVIASATGYVPALFTLVFVPAIARLVVWTISQPAKIDFYALGFSELLQGVLFSSLLIVSFAWH
jgi:YwiC-like protein